MRALISVSSKESVAEFAAKLEEMGVEIIATEGTASYLESRGVRVKHLSEMTGLRETPELKTLYPAVYEAIFSGEIDMVVVDLYPFEDMPCVENIDVGGVSLLRAASKNYRQVMAISTPEQYEEVVENLVNGVTEEFRLKLACEAFERIARYDMAIARWFCSLCSSL
ncbi:hypothetical protein Asulf_00776 [Archaeoglobus sulfaticallidus PM70-1]|uniref:MGS-like domain-containing protein n=1 Tax=Archaeoglobus sulfaticallidus PM70-1 TaxID=387631 RepID=N0BCP8_9EURY|nr:hypothetical protein [Archaeoglobus sulfaticallidus]AGK60788.1 hypothetical protein Asulf_00776 [Archaeoglobus sulfaticallidus PM70-1]